jgi:hypothetical protein
VPSSCLALSVAGQSVTEDITVCWLWWWPRRRVSGMTRWPRSSSMKTPRSADGRAALVPAPPPASSAQAKKSANTATAPLTTSKLRLRRRQQPWKTLTVDKPWAVNA